MNISIDQTFVTNFSFQLRDAPAKDVLEYCYPGAVKGGVVDGISVEISHRNGMTWFGSFASGKLSPNAALAVVTMPNQDHLMVISKGEAYIVNAADPLEWTHLTLVPVMGWISVKNHELILLWDFCRVVAIRSTSPLWRTPSISWDGIDKPLIKDNEAHFQVWNAPTSSHLTATVNLSTGVVVSDMPEVT